MNCSDARDLMVDCFDHFPDDDVVVSLMHHLEACPQCHEVFQSLQRTAESAGSLALPGASEGFKERIMHTIAHAEPVPAQSPARSWSIRLAAVAVAACVAVVAGSWFASNYQRSSRIALAAMTEAVDAMHDIGSIHIQARMRTSPHDNFQLILLDADFVPIELWKRWGDSVQWRVEEPGRVVVDDGDAARMLIRTINAVHESPDGIGYVGWLGRLLDPSAIIETEIGLIEKQGSAMEMTEAVGSDGEAELVVTVEAKPQSSYENDYLFNKSIEDSYNTRIYRLDETTKRLKALDIYVNTDQGDVLVFQTTAIDYDVPLDDALFTLDVPENAVAFVEPVAGETPGPDTPKAAAQAFFDACAASDWPTVARFMQMSEVPDTIKPILGGIELVHLGEPFQSGRYPGWFVPYEIRMSSGETKKHNLSVRNDNAAQVYLVDGGI